MSVLLDGPVLSAFVSIALKASLLLASAAVAQLLLRTRTSAAARHVVWTTTVAALLALPPLTAALPGWVVVSRAAGVASVGKNSGQGLQGAPQPIAMPAQRPNP